MLGEEAVGGRELRILKLRVRVPPRLPARCASRRQDLARSAVYLLPFCPVFPALEKRGQENCCELKPA